MTKSKRYIGLKEWIKKIIQEEGGGSGGGNIPDYEFVFLDPNVSKDNGSCSVPFDQMVSEITSYLSEGTHTPTASIKLSNFPGVLAEVTFSQFEYGGPDGVKTISFTGIVPESNRTFFVRYWFDGDIDIEMRPGIGTVFVHFDHSSGNNYTARKRKSDISQYIDMGYNVIGLVHPDSGSETYVYQLHHMGGFSHTLAFYSIFRNDTDLEFRELVSVNDETSWTLTTY